MELKYLKDLMAELDEDDQFEIDGGRPIMVAMAIVPIPPPRGGSGGC